MCNKYGIINKVLQLSLFLYDIFLRILQNMPDLSDISKGNIRRGKMGGSASRSGDRFSKNPYHHGDQEQFSVDEKQALSLERPNRPTPPNRPLPVLSVSLYLYVLSILSYFIQKRILH